MTILVIDDEASLRRTIRTVLESAGHRVTDASSLSQALAQLTPVPDLVLLDLRLGRESGLDAIPKLLAAAPALRVVMITAYASVDTAVEAMRRGAKDYLPKPFTPAQLLEMTARWGATPIVDADAALLQSDEPAMRAVFETLSAVSASDATILLRGESGTGKGVLARSIHSRSLRSSAAFVTVHCPSLPGDLLESDLFGHARGAFTGAVNTTIGKVTEADGGTLFLDEIGDLPLPLQPKLLRFAQDRTFERVGESKPQFADVRLIAATNRNLEAEVATGRFREDLLYRLNVVEVTVPPLRERPGDIPPLARAFLRQFGTAAMTPAAEAALARHRWPGNVRELRNVIERGTLLARGGVVDATHWPPSVLQPPAAATPDATTIDATEQTMIRNALATSPTLDEAARRLGIDPSTLYRKRKKYGL